MSRGRQRLGATESAGGLACVFFFFFLLSKVNALIKTDVLEWNQRKSPPSTAIHQVPRQRPLASAGQCCLSLYLSSSYGYETACNDIILTARVHLQTLALGEWSCSSQHLRTKALATIRYESEKYHDITGELPLNTPCT